MTNEPLEDHPFFQDLQALLKVRSVLRQEEEKLGGEIQDTQIETRQRQACGNGSEFDGEADVELMYEHGQLHSLHRIAVVVLVYALFESLCRGKYSHFNTEIDKEIIREAKKDSQEHRANYVVTFLDKCFPKEGKSSGWANRRQDVQDFVTLRNHLIHTGWRYTPELAGKLSPIPGDPKQPTKNDRLANLITGKNTVPANPADGQIGGDGGSHLYLPDAYICGLLKLLEQLAQDVIRVASTPC